MTLVKGLLERLRLWLIEKLGGYTRQQVIVNRDPPAQWIRPQIQRVWAETHIPWERACRMDKGAWGRIEMELVDELTRQLLLGQFVVIQTTRDTVMDETVVRGTVMAVSGKDVAIHEWNCSPESYGYANLWPL